MNHFCTNFYKLTHSRTVANPLTLYEKNLKINNKTEIFFAAIELFIWYFSYSAELLQNIIQHNFFIHSTWFFYSLNIINSNISASKLAISLLSFKSQTYLEKKILILHKVLMKERIRLNMSEYLNCKDIAEWSPLKL